MQPPDPVTLHTLPLPLYVNPGALAWDASLRARLSRGYVDALRLAVTGVTCLLDRKKPCPLLAKGPEGNPPQIVFWAGAVKGWAAGLRERCPDLQVKLIGMMVIIIMITSRVGASMGVPAACGTRFA